MATNLIPNGKRFRLFSLRILFLFIKLYYYARTRRRGSENKIHFMIILSRLIHVLNLETTPHDMRHKQMNMITHTRSISRSRRSIHIPSLVLLNSIIILFNNQGEHNIPSVFSVWQIFPFSRFVLSFLLLLVEWKILSCFSPFSVVFHSEIFFLFYPNMKTSATSFYPFFYYYYYYYYRTPLDLVLVFSFPILLLSPLLSLC